MPTPRKGSTTESRPPPRRRRRLSDRLGRSPLEAFIDSLSDADAASVLARMLKPANRGLAAAGHLDGAIWEVRIAGDRVIYSVLFAEEGARGQIAKRTAGNSEFPQLVGVARGRRELLRTLAERREEQHRAQTAVVAAM